MIGLDCNLFIPRHVLHDISSVLHADTSWGVKQSTVTWIAIAIWLRAWAVLFSLPGSAMGRETVYLCYDFRRFSKAGERISKEVPFNRLARTSKKYPSCQPPHPRCQPPDFCYQLCTPKGVHNNYLGTEEPVTNPHTFHPFAGSVLTKSHDDVIKWKHFPCYWPLVRGIHRSLVNSPHKGEWRGALMLSLICALNKRLSKQWWGWWFETHRTHYDVTVIHVLFLLWKTTSLDRPHISVVSIYSFHSIILQSSHHVVPPSCSFVFWGSWMSLHYVSTSVLLWLPWWTVRIRIRGTVPAATAQWRFSLIEPSTRLVWSWWRHQMETFSALLATCAGNGSVPGEVPAQRPVTWSFDVFFDQ